MQVIFQRLLGIQQNLGEIGIVYTNRLYLDKVANPLQAPKKKQTYV